MVRLRYFVVWALLALPLVSLYFNPAASLDGGAGMAALHIIHLLLAAGAVLLCRCIGELVLEWSGLSPVDSLERAFLSICAGFFVLVLAFLVLGGAGALHPAAVWALAALAVWGSRRVLPESRPAATPSVACWGGEGASRAAAVAFGALLGLLFFGSLIEALHPSPQSPDALAHNLAYARLFASSRGVVFTPHSPFYFAITGYWEMFLAGLALFVPSDVSMLVLAQLLHLIMGLGGAALGIVCLARRLSPLEGRAALALGLFGAAIFVGMRLDVYHVRRFPLLVVAPKSDLVVTALQAAGALAFFEAMKRLGGPGRRWALLGGVLLGAASGVKLTGGLAAVGLGAAFMAYPPAQAEVQERAALAGWAVAGVALGIAPMLAKNALALGNPVYPLMATYFGTYDNPEYFRYVVSGFRDTKSSWLDTGWRLSRLIAPSATFAILLAGLWPGMAPRGVRALFLALLFSIVVSAVIFSGTFPTRYVLFIAAFAAACAAALAGGLIGWIRARRGEGEFFSSPRALPAAWLALFVLAALPTHLDNRLKRAFRTAWRTPAMRARIFRMNPATRFQARWPGRLPDGARPLTFYRAERLFAVSKGWRLVVATESPEMMRLFRRGLAGEAMERELRRRGITHVYFEWPPPRMPGFPFDTGPLAAHLRARAPLLRADGFEMYPLSPGR